MQHETLFVYGTLQKGGAFHILLEGSQKLAKKAKTLDLYLLDVSPLFPRLYRPPSGWSGRPPVVVRGELYSVDPRLLVILDRLENVPFLYTREMIHVRAKHRTYTAWVFLATGNPQPQGVYAGRWTPKDFFE